MKLTELPEKPGVYIFKDKKSKALYVGKAANLKRRVGSYFQKEDILGPKTALMVRKTAKVEHIETESPLEALLLEADLIKRFKPKYNQRWKDDKHYKYIAILGGERVVTTRSAKDKNSFYFGPYPEVNVGRVLQTLRRMFPFRDCSKTKFTRQRRLKRPCLYGDINLCPAPCVGKVSQKQYAKTVNAFKLFLSGRRKKTEAQVKKEMSKAAKNQRFEEAAKLRDQLERLRTVAQSFRPPEDYLERPSLLADRMKERIASLAALLETAPLKLKRIEAYDVSNLQGKLAVGSLVAFVDGQPDKSQYRKFRIKFDGKPDDLAMIRETLSRRFKRLNKAAAGTNNSFSKRPDLILIDGGKGQLQTALKVLDQLELKIPVLALAKRQNTIYSRFLEFRLPKNSPALSLLKSLRDEAHRFALLYHRRRCRKAVFDTYN